MLKIPPQAEHQLPPCCCCSCYLNRFGLAHPPELAAALQVCYQLAHPGLTPQFKQALLWCYQVLRVFPAALQRVVPQRQVLLE